MPGCLIDILVAAAGAIHDDDFLALHFRCLFHEIGDRVRGFESRDNSFGLRKKLECGESFIIGRVSIFYAAGVA